MGNHSTLVSTVEESDFDPAVIEECLELSYEQGVATDYVHGVIRSAERRGRTVAINAQPTSDRMTDFLRGIPRLGGSLAKMREGMKWMRVDRGDDPGVRMLKRGGQVVLTVMTGATGLALVVDSEETFDGPNVDGGAG